MKRLLTGAFIILVVIGVYSYQRPLPAIQATLLPTPRIANQAAVLPWPAYGQGALAAQGYGLLQTYGDQKAVPIASVTKMVTALAILKQKPLTVGQPGPTITITSNDVAIYNSYYARSGSVVRVENGEQLSKLQALQALLLPSADNIADTLVIWAFGSMDSYLAYANKMVADMHLNSTKIADASGLSPNSVSSAQDLVELGLAALDNPLLVNIVSQQTAELPVVGLVNNVNWLLSSNGVIGIKTGNTDEAGGCFLFAAKRSIASQDLIIVGSILQAPDLNSAIKDARKLIMASDSGFESVKAVRKDQVVGAYKTAWGATADVIASQDLNILSWRGSQVQVAAKLNKMESPAKAGVSAGNILVTTGQKAVSAPVTIKSNLSGPPWIWRLFR